MIARFHILLPYAFTIPENEQYSVYEYEINGYNVGVYMPERSDVADSHTKVKNIKIDGVDAYSGDLLRIDFRKDSFDRKITNVGKADVICDPPIELIKDVANDFLSRLRYVTGGSKIKLLEFPFSSWGLKYLNDDGSDLPEEQGKVTGRGMRKYLFSFMGINSSVWEDVHSLEPFKPLPVWKTLLLDADALLPEVGPAIVLTFTALEVFITKTLDDVAKFGEIDDSLWEWINGRGISKSPNIEDKYTFLSSYLMGRSIKDDNNLWESFISLRKARNTFAHTGVSKVDGVEVTSEKVREFIVKASEIITFVKDGLSIDLHWPEFSNEMRVEAIQELMK